jgi:hypothetical protein
MTKQEIAKILQMPFPELAKLCHDPKELATVLSYAINMGINIGQRQAHEAQNRLLRGYNEVIISN